MATLEVENIFTKIVERAKELDPTNIRRWFEDLRLENFKGGSLRIGCPDEATKQFLKDNCSKSFTLAAQQTTGHLVSIDFAVSNGNKSSEITITSKGFKLHPDYTFDNFVVGPSNRLAHASCVAVSHSLGDTYNPLFIYGNSGLGKTHLLHAICIEAKNRYENAAIEFLSCEEFVNKFIQAIESGNLAGFQSQFRTVDLMVIDDIQFLSDREQSQEEFFHTFNALYNNGKQIILSADNPPSDIPSLEERLISRFNWGLVARVDPPSHDTRVAIVMKKAKMRGMEITEEIADYIARKVHANIRELEGALTRLYAFSLTAGKPMSMELAAAALADGFESSLKNISMTDIIDIVTRHFDVRVVDLQSKRRSQSITTPRQICMYLARNLTKHSLEEIGGHLGGRDHTTVMHACEKISHAQQADPHMHALLNDLTSQIVQTPRI